MDKQPQLLFPEKSSVMTPCDSSNTPKLPHMGKTTRCPLWLCTSLSEPPSSLSTYSFHICLVLLSLSPNIASFLSSSSCCIASSGSLQTCFKLDAVCEADTTATRRMWCLFLHLKQTGAVGYTTAVVGSCWRTVLSVPLKKKEEKTSEAHNVSSELWLLKYDAVRWLFVAPQLGPIYYQAKEVTIGGVRILQLTLLTRPNFLSASRHLLVPAAS